MICVTSTCFKPIARATTAATVLFAATRAADAAIIQPQQLRWGTTKGEIARSLPGDDLVPSPRYQSNRAILFTALAEPIWPYLAPFGQGRGGPHQ
jgi:hypothetical protein